MEKRTLYAVAVFVLLGLGALFTMRAPDKGERKGPPPRLFTVKAADITHIEVATPKGEKTTLEKKDAAWRVTSPSDWPADAQAVKALTEGLEKVSFSDIATENAAKHAEMGVGDTGSSRVKFTAGGQTVDLIVGQTRSGFTLVRLAGQNEVWQASNLQPYTINKAPKDWRDHSVMAISAAEISRLAVEVPGGSKIVVERKVEPSQPGQPVKPAPWTLVESSGDAPTAKDVLDDSQPTTVAQAVASMKAADFADGKSAKDAGLEPPALIVTVTAGGKATTLELSAVQGDDVYVRKQGDPTIYVVKKYLAERAMARPVDYRDKILLHYKADEIARVQVNQGKDVTSLENKDGKWVLAGAEADEQKAKALVGGAESFVGSSFVTDRSIKTELDKPRATITIQPKSGDKAVIKVGGLTKDNAEYYVMREGKKDVLTAKKFAVDRLLKKPSDLVRSAAPKVPAPPVKKK